MLQLPFWTTYGFVEEWVDLWDRAVAVEHFWRWNSTIAMLLYCKSGGGGVVNRCPFSFLISDLVLMSLTWMLMTVVEIRCWISFSIYSLISWTLWSLVVWFFFWFRIRHVQCFMSLCMWISLRSLVVGLEIRVVEFCDCMFVYVFSHFGCDIYWWVEPFQYRLMNLFVCVFVQVLTEREESRWFDVVLARATCNLKVKMFNVSSSTFWLWILRLPLCMDFG